jgi:hypothetical protein
MYARAIEALERAVQLSGDIGHKGALGSPQRRPAHPRRDAESQTAQLRTTGPNRMIYAAFGEKNEAVRWLEKGFAVHDGNMPLVKLWPPWDSLRPDPRFQALLQRMKFP